MTHNDTSAPNISSTPEMPIKWVRVSTELLAQLGEWSEPVQVQVVGERDGELEMVFRRVGRPSVTDCSDPWECCIHTPEELEEARGREG